MSVLSLSKTPWLLVVFLALACAPRVWADVKFTAVGSPIQLKENQTSGPVNLFVRIEGSKKQPEVHILSVSQTGPAVVLKDKPTPEVDLQNGVFWKIPAYISNLPLGANVSVSLVVKVETAVSDVLTYSITNTPVIPDTDVYPSGTTIFTESSRDMTFTVNLKGSPLRGLTVCRAALSDANTTNELPTRWLSLYLEGADLEANPRVNSPFLTLVAPTSRVHLYVSPEFKDDGVFAGSVDLCATNKPTVGKLTLTVYSSSPCMRLLGAVLILAGIALFLVVTVFLKQRSLRLGAQLPATRLRESLQNLQTATEDVVSATGVPLPVLLGDGNTDHSLESLIDLLSDAKLEQYLPARLLSNPFLQPNAGTDYQQYLSGIATQQQNDSIIVGDGLRRVRAMWSTLDPQSASQALQDLDALAEHASTSTTMQTDVDTIVHGITRKDKTLVGHLLASDLELRQGEEHTHTTHEILFELEYVSFLGWLLWALLTFVLGYAALILNHHGFGTTQDLFKCFLWGIGIQAAGQGLQALNPASAATSFSLQVGR
jgi:hypothetical protein